MPEAKRQKPTAEIQSDREKTFIPQVHMAGISRWREGGRDTSRPYSYCKGMVDEIGYQMVIHLVTFLRESGDQNRSMMVREGHVRQRKSNADK